MFKFIIPKGSITIDGISLTVVKAEGDAFTVSIIPHTLGETVLAHKRPGERINIECDVLGKYVDHLLHYGSRSGQEQEEKSSKISHDFLAANGFV